MVLIQNVTVIMKEIIATQIFHEREVIYSLVQFFSVEPHLENKMPLMTEHFIATKVDSLSLQS